MPDPTPTLAIGLGRGRTGKSTLLRWVIGRALNAGREVDAADGDRHNATLTAFYKTARRPPSIQTADMKDWLESVFDRQATEKRSVALDLTGGERVVTEMNEGNALLTFCAEHGIEPVALVCVGPSLDDLAHALGVMTEQVVVDAGDGTTREETSLVFRRTVLVFNEGLVPQERDTAQAFAPLYKRKEVGTLAKLGAQLLLMPRLGCMPKVDEKRLDFWAAVQGSKGTDGAPVGPFQRSQVKSWLAGMETAFGPALPWLP